MNDKDGFIGKFLRENLPIKDIFGLDEKVFACCFVGLFMQITGVLQMPQFLGPSFTPFGTAILSPFLDSSTWTVGKYEVAYAENQKKSEMQNKKDRSLTPRVSEADSQDKDKTVSKSKRKRNKKKTGAGKEKTA